MRKSKTIVKIIVGINDAFIFLKWHIEALLADIWVFNAKLRVKKVSFRVIARNVFKFVLGTHLCESSSLDHIFGF